MKLVNSVALKQEIANVMPSRTEVFLVIDAMPDAIVRCKDCKHYDGDENSGFGTCLKNGVCSTPEWYCADGERKE